MRPRSRSPKRNTVSVRFDDSALADVEAAAGKNRLSPWIRDAAVEKARGLNVSVSVILPPGAELTEDEKGQA